MRFTAFIVLLCVYTLTNGDILFEDVTGEYSLLHSDLSFCSPRLSLQVEGSKLTRLTFNKDNSTHSNCSIRSIQLARGNLEIDHPFRNELGIGVWTTTPLKCAAFDSIVMDLYKPNQTFEYGIFSLRSVLHEAGTKYVHLVHKNPAAWCVYRELSTSQTSFGPALQESDFSVTPEPPVESGSVSQTPTTSPITPMPPSSLSPRKSSITPSASASSSFSPENESNLAGARSISQSNESVMDNRNSTGVSPQASVSPEVSTSTIAPSPSSSPKITPIAPSPSSSLSPAIITITPTPVSSETSTKLPNPSTSSSAIKPSQSPKTGVLPPSISPSITNTQPLTTPNPSSTIASPLPDPQLTNPTSSSRENGSNLNNQEAPAKREINGELWGGIIGGIATVIAAIITVLFVRKRRRSSNDSDSGVQVQVFTSDFIRRQNNDNVEYHTQHGP